MINDLPPDFGNNPIISRMSELRDAIEDKDWKDRHIKLEADDFRISDVDEFEDLQSNDEQKPIVIKAKDIGGATIRGNGSLIFKRPNNLILYGIKFEYSTKNESGMLFEEATNCRIARCDFKIGSFEDEYTYLTLKGGDSNCIAYNRFHDKKGTTGQFLRLKGVEEGDDIVGCTRTVIEYNHFKTLTGVEDKGEALFIGGSEAGRLPFKTIVRFNLFENCEGDKESITNKSCCNSYHHYTFRGNDGSLSLRHGSGNIVRDNIFLAYPEGHDNEGVSNNGIRLSGNEQTIVNNFFKCKQLSKSDLLRPLVIGNGNWHNDPTREELEGMPDQKRKCLDNSPNEFRRHATYAQVKGSTFKKNVIIVEGGNNDDDRTIVIWGHNRGSERCPRDFKPKSNKFEKNIIIAKSGTMFKIGNGATVDDNRFSDNKLHKEDGGSARRGNMPNDGISSDAPTQEERTPPEALKESDVGPLSERSDQPHCSREDLSSLTEQRCS
jgi:Chondroitinase B